MRITGMLATVMSLSIAAGASAQSLPPNVFNVVNQSGLNFDTNSDNFNILNTALRTAGLVSALRNPNQFVTVFAPNDGAFVTTARDLGFGGTDEAGAWNFLVQQFTTLGNGNPVPVLRNVLLAHVSPEGIPLFRLRSLGASLTPFDTLLNGASFRTTGDTIVDADAGFENPRITSSAAIRTGNGIIHVLDRVILPVKLSSNTDVPVTSEPNPGTLAGLVATGGGRFDSNGNDYDLLARALATANLLDTLGSTTLSATLFAPNDAAFIQTARDLGFGGTDEAGAWTFLVQAFTTLGNGNPIPVLTNVLRYHVVGQTITPDTLARAAAASRPINTLQGVSFSVQIAGGNVSLVDADPQVTNPSVISPLNLRVRNGVLHTVDRVLIPLDLP